MEMTAVIEALARVEAPVARSSLHTDSTYVHEGHHRVDPRLEGASGWRTAAKEPVKNVDLWKTLDEAVAARTRSSGSG